MVDADLEVKAALHCFHLGLVCLTGHILLKVKSNVFAEVLFKDVGKRVGQLMLGAKNAPNEASTTELDVLNLSELYVGSEALLSESCQVKL